jgi:hypothetical protein
MRAAALAVAVIGLMWTATAQAAITQPAQPKHRPGRQRLTTEGWQPGGTPTPGAFEGKSQPENAPLAIVMHGYYEFSGYDQLRAFI